MTWARIACLEGPEQLKLLAKRWQFKKFGLASYLLDEAEPLAAKGNLDKARECVRFSVAVTSNLPFRVYGGPAIADLRLRQATILSNINRIDLDFIGALEALRQADRLKGEGIDLAERARFFRVQAALLFDLGEFEDGARAARMSTLIYSALGDIQSKGKALLQEAMILAQFDPGTGLERANEGLATLNHADSYSFITGVYNKALCLIQLRRAPEANEFLSIHRGIVREIANTRAGLSFQALDALILKSRGEIRAAEQLFSYLAHRFREEGLFREMILSHLERIRIKADTGRWKSAVNIATRLTPELARLGLRNDLLGMWASLQDALSQRRDVVSEIENLFRRRWNAPGLLASR